MSVSPGPAPNAPSERGGRLTAALRRVPFLPTAVRWFRSTFLRHRINACILEGHERASGAPLRVFFAGQLENRNYFANIAFAPGRVETDMEPVWRWNAFRRARRACPDADITCVQMDHRMQRFFHGDRRFFVPAWLTCWMDVPSDVAALKHNSRLEDDLRRIRKQKFTYQVSTDRATLERFYTAMYLPYIRQNYGERAFVEPYENLQREWSSCKLISILKQDAAVAGVVLRHDASGHAHAWVLGVRDGDRELVRNGVIAAVYFFFLEYLSSHGYRGLDVGDARPFLRDGVLRYKRKWGARITGPYNAEPGFMLAFGKAGNAAAAFLLNNPFVALEDHRLVGLIFHDAADATTEAEMDARCREHYCAGINDMRLLSVSSAAWLARLGERRVGASAPDD